MKKVFLFAAAAVTTAFGAKAQTTQFGIEAGLNLSSYHAKTTNPIDNSTESGMSDMKIGLRAGVVADLGITSNFSVQPGIFFSQMGGKDKSTGAKTGVSYIQVPVNAVYNFNSKSGTFFIGAGPYVAYAVHAKVTLDDLSQKLSVGTKETDDVKPFDFGVDVMLGYRLTQGVYIKAAYNFGLLNYNPQNSDLYNQKNMGFAFTVGYMFGGK